jgi:nucleotide-binding universal stress UspA family protein
MPNDNDGAVLFAYDGSTQAQAAIRAAGQQLRRDRAAIVVTVWEPLAALPFGAPAFPVPDLEEGIDQSARNVVDEGVALAAQAGFRATPLATEGAPVWRAIVECAEQRDVGIVVMGSHGRTGIGLVLMGSVAAAVARHATRPVLIVHPPAE